MTAPETIISDEEINRVHGHANFGDMTPREVVNDGVRKYAVGYSGGHTQLCILLEHGLIRKPKLGKYGSVLTEKGKRYARSIWDTHFRRSDLPPSLSAAMELPEVKALVEAAREHLSFMETTGFSLNFMTNLRTALAAIEKGTTP